MSPDGMPEWDVTLLQIPGVTLRKEVPLSRLGSFQLGGPAALVLECSQPEVLGQIRKICNEHGLQALLIGEGSNILFSDDGWPGIIVRFAGEPQEPVQTGEGTWKLPASMNLQDVVDWATRKGYAGLESFNGIPGTLGGAVVGNAGAWGVQMEHVLCEVSGYDSRGEVHQLTVEDCGFSYRDSRMKHEDFWVSGVTLHLTKGESSFLEQERERILALRAARHPDWKTEPCIGSFFKNLEPSSAAERRQAAGYFLEGAGAKTQKVGGAGVFHGHANILVKEKTDCTAADIAALARRLQSDVKKMHGIDLEREVRYLGCIPGETETNGFY